jgi:flavin-dependent dehydrogenase
MNNVEWDVIVVGAGPAGAVAAYELARRGISVLLVERQKFPRYKVCGACVNARALATLQSVGLDSRTAHLKGIPLRRLDLGCGKRALHLPLPGGIAVSREQFDQCLVQAAIDEGATFLPQTAACVQRECGPSTREVTLRDGLGRESSSRARLVLAAGGLASSCLRNVPELASRACASARVGIGATTNDFPDFYRPGVVSMAIGRNGYVGLTEIESGVLNVAAAVDADFLRSHGSPVPAVASILQGAGFPGIPSLETAPWQGTVPLTRRSMHVAGPRIFLLGDAAGYVEPFTGEGIAWALASAVAVVPLAMAGFEEWNAGLVRQWDKLHRRCIRRNQTLCRALSRVLRHPQLLAGLLHAFSWSPSLASLVVERASGVASGTRRSVRELAHHGNRDGIAGLRHRAG